jgi:hypothetical protein
MSRFIAKVLRKALFAGLSRSSFSPAVAESQELQLQLSRLDGKPFFL